MLLLLIVIAAVLAGGVYYAWSLRVHPWRRCRRCKGTGRTRDRVWRGATGSCPRCGRRGQLPRLGIRVLTPGRAKAMTAPKGSHKKADHRRRP